MSSEEEVLQEVKEIKEIIKPAPPPPPPKNILDEFKQFLNKYKVMGLAVAFIMAQYLGSLVRSLVDNLVMPLVTFFLPTTIPWEEFELWVFRIGAFLGELITFVIVAFVIFLLVKYTKKMGIE